MQVLTPSGYVDILDLNIGDEVIAYDINTGAVIINHLEGKTLWTPDMYPPDEIPGHYETVTVSYEEPEVQYVWVEVTVIDEQGQEAKEWVQEPQVVIVTKYRQEEVWIDPVIIRTSYEVFQSVQGDWVTYRINDTWNLYKDQSVWANMRVTNAKDLQIGDILYNDQDGDVVITSIEQVNDPFWWKLDVSGDSSYIADGLTMHNASRYWVGGGSSSNWNATGNTNWGSASGVQDNASVPTSADIVNFDGAGVAGNTNSTISAITTIAGYIITSGYTSTLTHNADLTIAGSITLGANYTIAGSSKLIISAACTLTSNGKTWPNGLTFSTGTITTLVGNLTINGFWECLNNISPTINSTTTETLTCGGGIGSGNNAIPTGTAKHIATGGALSSTTGYGAFALPLDIQGNVTIVQFGFQNKPFNYISGTVTTTGGKVRVGGTATLNLNGIAFNDFEFGGSVIPASANVTLTSNLLVNGVFTHRGTCNKTTAETITVYGGIWSDSGGGTAEVICKGGNINTSLNSTINAPLTLDGNITFTSNVLYYTGQYGNGGTLKYLSGTNNSSTSKLYIWRQCTINTPTLTWASMDTQMQFSGIITLLGDLTITGALTNINGLSINRTTTEKISIGGLVSTGALGGTATVELTGGTWSGAGSVSNPININGNVTISGNVYHGTGTVTYIGGSVTGGTLFLTANCTLNTSTMGWNNLTIASGTIYTLTSDLRINGVLSAAVGGGTKINKTANEVVYCYGGFNIGNNFTGTATIVAKSGTLISNGFSAISGPPLNIDGDVTISGSFTYGSGTMTYISGSVITSGTTLGTGSATLNTKGIIWNNVSFADTTTLTSDMTINGLVTNVNGTILNKTNNEKFYLRGGYNPTAFWVRGNATLVFQGGTWTGGSGISTSTGIEIDGDIILGPNCNVGQSGGLSTLSYKSGRILSGTLNVLDNFAINDFHKCPIPSVIVTAGKTVTMNQFFTGTPQRPASITASTAAGQYTIAFTDSFERIAENVVLSGCVLSRPQQLIVSSPQRINTLKTTNRGVRFINQSPNGFAKNAPTVSGFSTGPAMSLASDPCFTKQS